MSIPPFADLELTWEVSVRRANVGISATFVPDGVEGPPLPEDVPAKGGSGGVKKPRRRLFGRKGCRAGAESAEVEETTDGESVDDDGVEDHPSERLSSSGGLVEVHAYERLTRGGVADGIFRFHGQGGKVVFILDNSYSKTRRKRVFIKLVTESISPQAEEQEQQAELAEIDHLRAEVLKTVPDPSGYLANDMTVRRFLDARPTLQEAVAMLTNTLRWRNEGRYFMPEGCPQCRQTPGTHVWRQIGFDKERRPVIFLSLSQVLPLIRASYNPFQTLFHIVDVLENGHKTMEPEAAYGFTWVIDAHGASMADVRLISRLTGEMEEGQSKDGTPGGKKESFISVLGDHYPQTLGSCAILRAPMFIMTVWNAVRAFMDPKTAKAYYIIRSPQAIDKALDALFDKDTGDWIRKEIELIVADPVAPAVAAGRTFRGPDFWRPPSSSSTVAHDSRGNAEYVRRFCCPAEDRAEGDRLHRPHPNICQVIEATNGGEAVPLKISAKPTVATSQEVPRKSSSKGATAKQGAGSEAGLGARQEREETRKIIRMTLKKLKEAVDKDRERQAQAKRGRRAAQRWRGKKQEGLSYATLERLSQPETLDSVESSEHSGDESTDLDEILNEMLQTEGFKVPLKHFEESEEVEEDDEDDDDDGSEFDLDSVAEDSVESGGGDTGMQRVVVHARGIHEEVIQVGGGASSMVSWTFQVGSGDVAFVAAFCPETDGEGAEAANTVVVPWARYRNRRVHSGEWRLPVDETRGTLTLRWDNSYSRVRSKVIKFDVKK
mmetsp:Transcript_62243/g.124763  ORF Transcript_62243/g.124763 Transcript_62243/m.124763 type:complete len:776 (+) Transcript_62243:333-2660(+)